MKSFGVMKKVVLVNDGLFRITSFPHAILLSDGSNFAYFHPYSLACVKSAETEGNSDHQSSFMGNRLMFLLSLADAGTNDKSRAIFTLLCRKF